MIVDQGQYLERLDVVRSVQLKGGYEYVEGMIREWPRDIEANPTVIDGQYGGTTVWVHGADVEALIEGFTITRGQAEIYGIGGGVRVDNHAAATLRQNRIFRNRASGAGAGILIWNDSGRECVVEQNRIYSDTADGEPLVPDRLSVAPDRETSLAQMGSTPGGGAFLAGGDITLRNNFIYWNDCGAGGDVDPYELPVRLIVQISKIQR